MSSYTNQDPDLHTGKHAVMNHKLHECGMCGNPVPYQCEDCQGNIAEVLQTSAQHMGLSTKDGKVFVGGGEIIPLWTVAEGHDCQC